MTRRTKAWFTDKYISKENLLVASLVCIVVLITAVVILSVVVLDEQDSQSSILIPPITQPTKSPTKSPTEAPTNTPTESPTKSPTKSPTESPTKSPTEAPITYIATNKAYTRPNALNVVWPDTLVDPIYVDFRFRYTETPVSNATLIDCQNQTKLYAGWKIYLEVPTKL